MKHPNITPRHGDRFFQNVSECFSVPFTQNDTAFELHPPTPTRVGSTNLTRASASVGTSKSCLLLTNAASSKGVSPQLPVATETGLHDIFCATVNVLESQHFCVCEKHIGCLFSSRNLTPSNKHGGKPHLSMWLIYPQPTASNTVFSCFPFVAFNNYPLSRY
jgi:hypothetical protein